MADLRRHSNTEHLVRSLFNLVWFCLMVLNATFNNISVISWRCFIGGGNRRTLRKSPTCRKSLVYILEGFQTYYFLESTEPLYISGIRGTITVAWNSYIQIFKLVNILEDSQNCFFFI